MNQQILQELKERLKVVPLLPGVYLFKNQNGDVIYVGKAKVLRNRLRSYFQAPEGLDPKVKAMMMKVHDFDYVVTSSEVEALVLECNMIKSYHPKYNIFFRDDKSYPYLKLTLHEEYPRIMITREKARDSSRYYGPYTDATALKDTVRMLTGIFPLRTCKEFRVGRRPCLNRDIGRCLAPCTGEVDRELYMQMVSRVIALLEKDSGELIKQIEQEMHEAAERLDFELAARNRDNLAAIKKMSESQKVASTSALEVDLIASAGLGKDRLMIMFHIRNGKLVAKDTYWLNAALSQEPAEVLAFFIQQYYDDNTEIPAEILTQIAPAEQNVLESWLSGKRGGKSSIKVPARGEKKSLLDMAVENAVLLYEERLRQAGSNQEILGDLGRTLGLQVVPERIECFDISHLGGEETVASMVVFTGAEKDAKAYRRFKVNVHNNDYQAMAEVLTRRLRAGLAEEAAFLPMPDLIMVDGGLGQANIAAQVAGDLNVDIPIIGLAKKHEEIFKPGESRPLRLPANSEMLKLLQRIRDEAHRFAIGHNRKRIRKRALVSILDHIEGIGENRRQQLLNRFGSVEGIKQASVEDIAKVPGMNIKAAQAVYDFFHNQEI